MNKINRIRNISLLCLSFFGMVSCNKETTKTSVNPTNSSEQVNSSTEEKTSQSYYDKSATKKTVSFGTYPQSKVSDESKIETLNTKAGELPTSSSLGKWKDYGYYLDGKKESYSFYIDIDEDGDGKNDYRGVYFTKYRPTKMDYKVSDETEYAQKENGYLVNSVYWFKYETINWEVLDVEGDYSYIISPVLDVTHYYHSIEERSTATDYQGNTSTEKVLPNNYKYSDLRNFLNTSFYDFTFTKEEQSKIQTYTVKNPTDGDTSDKVFVLSASECSTYYNTNNTVIHSDYSACQGLGITGERDSVLTWTRTPSTISSEGVMSAFNSAYASITNSVLSTSVGVRAVIKAKL
jgi:hypothetical protein